MTTVPDELKWYELDPGQWLVIEAPAGTPHEQAQATIEAVPAAIRSRVLVVLGKAWVLTPPEGEQ